MISKLKKIADAFHPNEFLNKTCNFAVTGEKIQLLKLKPR